MRDLRQSLDAEPPIMGGALSEQSYFDVQGSNDEAFGWGQRVYTKGGFTNGLRPGTLEALVAHVGDAIGENGMRRISLGLGAGWTSWIPTRRSGDM